MTNSADYAWRVRYPRSGATAYFKTRASAVEEADGNGWADPIVEGYVAGVGWQPSTKIARDVCPVCGGDLVDIRGKMICGKCRQICEGCCEG